MRPALTSGFGKRTSAKRGAALVNFISFFHGWVIAKSLPGLRLIVLASRRVVIFCVMTSSESFGRILISKRFGYVMRPSLPLLSRYDEIHLSCSPYSLLDGSLCFTREEMSL